MTRSAALVCTGAAIVSMLACPSLDPFVCLSDEQCTLASEGQCHPHGVCSYPDDLCDSRRRYSANAGELARQCVDETATGTGSGTASEASDVSDTGSGPDSSSGPGPLSVCGDGIVEGDEQCDDGMDELDPLQCNDCTADCQRVTVTMETTFEAPSARWSSFDAVIVEPGGALVVAGNTSLDGSSATFDRLIARYDLQGALLGSFTEERGGRDQLRDLVTHPVTQATYAIGMWDSDPSNMLNEDDNELLVAEYTDVDQLLTAFLQGSIDPNPSMGQGGTFFTDGRLVVVGMTDNEETPGFERWDRLIVDDVLESPRVFEDLGLIVPPEGQRDIVYDVAGISDGGIVVGGTITEPGQTQADRWLARLGPDGEWLMRQNIDGGSGDAGDEIFAVLVRNDQVIAVGNNVYNNGNMEQEWAGRFNLDDLSSPDGWDVDLPVELPAQISGVIEHEEGLVLTLTSGPEGAQTGIVAKVDDNGLCQWIVRAPANASSLVDLTGGPDGSIVVTGAYHEFDDQPEPEFVRVSGVVAALRVGG